jgi:hypothetical protein
MRETNRAEKTMRDAGCEPDRASAEAARGVHPLPPGAGHTDRRVND